ncbi:MAG: hypothetical protein JWR69_799 [Pedosphaera sp.]|nr:hypothetical protein [Pedosphaera sp.]
MSITKYLIILGLGFGFSFPVASSAADSVIAGPLFSEYDLTLDSGHRKEIASPFFYSEQRGDLHTWAFPLLTLAHTEDPTIGYKEFDFAYPLFTYDRFGSEYRWQFCQLFAFGGGIDQKEDQARRFTLFPIYFQQRSPDPSQNYTALIPLYGHLKNRLFRDEINFVLMPFYVKTRKKDVVNIDTPYPFFTRSYGDGLRAWQAWPFVGHDHKEVTTRTNGFGDVESIPGHDDRFVLWPFYTQAQLDIGTENTTRQQTLIPFYSFSRSKLRDSTSYLWPIGYTHTVDREKKYTEWDAPWPLIVFARGEGKHTDRVWPFYSKAYSPTVESDWIGWLVYKHNHYEATGLTWDRSRILYFLYSDVKQKNKETGATSRRVDLWPLFTHRRDFKGNERLQILSVIEPVLPASKSVERDYSQIYALWRSEKNADTGAGYRSLLWDTYRRETTPYGKKISLLFGLFQYQSSPEGKHWRLCYIPMGK